MGQFIRAAGVNVHYVEHGVAGDADAPTALLLHGFSPDLRLMTGCFEPIFESRPEWRRVYLDLPGMGQTVAPMMVAEHADRDVPPHLVIGRDDKAMSRLGVVGDFFETAVVQDAETWRRTQDEIVVGIEVPTGDVRRARPGRAQRAHRVVDAVQCVGA